MKAKNAVPQLTPEYFRMLRCLLEGYPAHREKLEALFFGITEDTEMKVVITAYFNRVASENVSKDVSGNNPKEDSENLTAGSTRNGARTHSARLFSGRTTILVVYPNSGKVYEGRVRVREYLCAIEPIKSNRAFWIFDRKYLDDETIKVIDLNVIPHLRQIHNKAGREFLSTFT